jgi:hypothetical protein
MINIFFDCEFTKLQEGSDTEPNKMISIGCISENGKRFYAENATTLAHPEYFSEFVVQTVIPLLEGGDCLMPDSEIAKSFCSWIESFEGKVKMWTDAPGYDWPHVEQMFDN